MKEELISIAIPIVKHQFLIETIESVLSQNYNNFEIVLLNNASTDSTRIIIKEICLTYHDARIRYFENNSQLPPIENWNKCLQLAKGTLFSLLSDDDYYESDFLSELSTLYSKNKDEDVFRCRSRIVNEFNKTIDYTVLCPEKETVVDFIWHRLKGFRLQFLTEFLFKRKTLLDLGGFVSFKNAWCSDDATWINLALQKGVIITSSKILCNYRVSEKSITSISNPSPKLEAICNYNIWFKKMYFENHSKFLLNNDEYMVLSIPKFNEIRIVKLKRDALSRSKSFFSLILFWVKNKNKYFLTFSDLLYSTTKYFYNKT
jgi:glycosyltransferase involved in cell wall biosynthesis